MRWPRSFSVAYRVGKRETREELGWKLEMEHFKLVSSQVFAAEKS